MPHPLMPPETQTIPVIYFVTPTYARSVQIAELTRLGQTLSNVPALHWILVEDANECNPILGQLLKRIGKAPCFESLKFSSPELQDSVHRNTIYSFG